MTMENGKEKLGENAFELFEAGRLTFYDATEDQQKQICYFCGAENPETAMQISLYGNETILVAHIDCAARAFFPNHEWAHGANERDEP